MLFLLFRLGNDRYALDVNEVARVLPLDALREAKAIPGAPAWVTGVFAWHGAPVPIIDLTARALGRPAEHLLSTRVVLARYPVAAPHGTNAVSAPSSTRLLALIVEQATHTARLDAGDFTAAGVDVPGASYLGPVAPDPAVAGKLLQKITLAELIPADVHALLFNAENPT